MARILYIQYRDLRFDSSPTQMMGLIILVGVFAEQNKESLQVDKGHPSA